MTMEWVFWLSYAFIIYVYAGYPLLLGATARISRRLGLARALHERRSLPVERRQSARLQDRRRYPGVSVVIAARNEAARLPARIENLLASDYPKQRLQIIVASDGSTDATADVLAPFGAAVELVSVPPSGKAAALNAAVNRASHGIVVFADARQRFAPDAIRRLVAHFHDPRIGAVSGELILDCEGVTGLQTDQVSTVADGVGAYWKYEKWLRKREAEIGSTLGVTGAIYAMRRWLWQPLPDDTLLDDVLAPMRVVMRGYRVTFDGLARAFDVTAKDASVELRRKVRTLAGNFQLLAREPRLLVPGLNPVWLQFMSHKVGRLLVPYALIGLLVSSVALARHHWVYACALAGQLAFYGLAAYGAALDRRAAAAAPVEVIREAA